MAVQKDDGKSYRMKALPCELGHFFDIKKNYVLKVSDYQLSIIDPKYSKVIYTLPFKHIKQYGLSEKEGGFRLKTGSKCIIGEGILDFCVQPFEKVKEIKDTLHVWSAGLKDDGKTYRMKVLPCELGHFFDIKKNYVLKVSDYQLIIIDPKYSKVIYTLPFKHIKQYSVSEKGGGVSLKTGSKCIIGEGILDFCVQPFEKVKEIKETLHVWLAELKAKNTNQEVLESKLEEVYDDINEVHIDTIWEPAPDY